MDEKGFRRFIKEGKRVPKGLDEATIRSHLRMVKEFERFLRKRGPGKDFTTAKASDVKAFVKSLAKSKRNTFDNLIGLLRYSRFLDNRDAELPLLIMLDGANVLNIMCDTFKNLHGERKFDEVLGDFEPPAIGTPPKSMPKATADFMERLGTGIGRAATVELLLTGPHAGPPEYYLEERKMLRSSKNVDDYLRKRRERFIKELKGYMDTGTLFFTQKIDQDVLDFVKGNPEIAGGVRKGKYIYCTKVPYMAIEYLLEKDDKLKRYYYCHCPLARESIMSGQKMPRDLCYCSAGYEKRPFDVAFGEPLKAIVKKSVLWGDTECRFAIELPEKYR